MDQWLRIHLSVLGTRVQPLVWEDPPGRGATESACHSYWSPRALGLHAATREAAARRSRRTAAREEPPLVAARERPHGSKSPAQPKINTLYIPSFLQCKSHPLSCSLCLSLWSVSHHQALLSYLQDLASQDPSHLV